MNDPGFRKFKTFRGSISAEGNSYAFDFRVSIESTGEIEFDLGTIPLSNETVFIKSLFFERSVKRTRLRLSGVANDGTEFETDRLYLKSLGTPFTADAGVSLKPFARCSSGKFRQIRESFTEAPVLRTWIKGFQNFDKLRAETPREFIAMTGLHKIDELNDLSGWIALQAKKAPADAVEWRARGDKLLDHVLRIMSFASSSLLRAPVQQFYFGNVVETTVRSQSKQTASSLRVFPHANQQGIFESAFTSFFSPPIAVEKLFFAIEWFAMDSSYNEVRLVNAMTALENLLDSNLLDADAFIEPKNDFKKTRKVLRRVISQCLTKWNSGSTKEINDLKEQLNEKLGDLNRRSLHRKLDILVERWKVPLKGISSPSIEAAKKARDRVVHRGAY